MYEPHRTKVRGPFACGYRRPCGMCPERDGAAFQRVARHCALPIPCLQDGTAVQRFETSCRASNGPIAQRLEQGTHNPLVAGSNPAGPTCPRGEWGVARREWGAKRESRVADRGWFTANRVGRAISFHGEPRDGVSAPSPGRDRSSRRSRGCLRARCSGRARRLRTDCPRSGPPDRRPGSRSPGGNGTPRNRGSG